VRLIEDKQQEKERSNCDAWIHRSVSNESFDRFTDPAEPHGPPYRRMEQAATEPPRFEKVPGSVMCAGPAAFLAPIGIVAPIMPPPGPIAAITEVSNSLNLVSFKGTVSCQYPPFERIEKTLAFVLEKSGVCCGQEISE